MVSDTTYIQQFNESLDFFQKDIATIRTGRATPALIEHVAVDAYGVKTPLVHLASITVSDARTLVIQPWDKGIVKEIEKSLAQSDVGSSPQVDGAIIRLIMPQLTEENRRNLVKILHQKAEAVRVKIRQYREKARGDIQRSQENGEISEDEKFKAQKQLDEAVKKYTDMVADIADKKEGEIMTI